MRDVPLKFREERQTVVLILGVARLLKRIYKSEENIVPLRDVENGREPIAARIFTPMIDNLDFTLMRLTMKKSVDHLAVSHA